MSKNYTILMENISQIKTEIKELYFGYHYHANHQDNNRNIIDPKNYGIGIIVVIKMDSLQNFPKEISYPCHSKNETRYNKRYNEYNLEENDQNIFLNIMHFAKNVVNGNGTMIHTENIVVIKIEELQELCKRILETILYQK